MNVYQFKYHSGETDWVVAPEMREAKSFYKNHIGDTDLEGFEVTKLTKKQLREHHILDVDSPEPDIDGEEEYNPDEYSNGFKILMTFEEYLKTAKSTELFCTSEY
jgi:hypothetical protein